MADELYKTLGVSKKASDEEAKKLDEAKKAKP